MPSRKGKWEKDFKKHSEDRDKSEEPEEPRKQKKEGNETPSPGTEGTQGACGTAADEKPGGRRKGGRFRGKNEVTSGANLEKPKQTQKGRGRGASSDYEKGQVTSPSGGGTPLDDNLGKPKETRKGRGRGASRDYEKSPVTSPSGRGSPLGDNLKKPKQTQKGRGRRASRDYEKSRVMSPSGRGTPLDCRNQEQRPGRPNPRTGNQNSNNQGHVCRVIPGKSNLLDFKTLKGKHPFEVVDKLIEGIAPFKVLLRSKEEQHNSDEFVFDLTCTLAVACRAPSGENTNKILAALKGSVFLNLKIPRLLDSMQVSIALNDHDSRRRFIECLIMVFRKYLTHLPSSYVDLPYDQLKLALDQSSIQRKEEIQKELDAFKEARDEIIRGERQKHGKRYINRVREKPPNDFRDMPICPTNKEITTQERPFLRKNITKGRYENAEHYLDVQFRLLREDFLEPLREGIHEIVQNLPRKQRNQFMRNYRSVQILRKELTQSGIIHEVQIDVSELDTRRWAHSKRLIYGSFICLSKDNFKTMLFATVADRNPDDLKRGRIDIRFIEGQDVLGIESRNCVYQMVESPAYFEAYRYVLKGLKELDETTLPFKKYLVECSEEVDPPEYLRRHDAEKPVFYDLRKALGVRDASNASAVPVLTHGAWPSVKELSLNNSQLEAIKTAITTEFSVIQGPPGTGKTYVGAKIVRCLLENRTAWDPQRNSPMLMVCYTNHALDQFLEKVLEFLPHRHIIRVGGRSKSEKLEGCNLKNFTRQYRLSKERSEVQKKMAQKDLEMKKWKRNLLKADKELLLFDDMEELLHSTHADQLYHAKFPYDVANKCRTPGNIFKLWLSDNMLVNTCNRSTKVQKADEKERHFAVTILEEISPNGNDDTAFLHLIDPSKAVDGSKVMTKSRPEPNEYFAEQQQLKRNCYNNTSAGPSIDEHNGELGDKTSPFVCTASIDDDINPPRFMEEANSIKQDEDPKIKQEETGERVEELDNCDNETIDIEKEADLIRDQRWIQGDEELLMPISEQANALISQEQHKARKDEDTYDALITESYRENVGSMPFPWQKTEDQDPKEERIDTHQGFDVENGDETAKNDSTRKKEGKKDKNKVFIYGDISLLKASLQKVKMMSCDEAISVENIWSLSQSDRLRLYLFWIETYRERYRSEIHRAEHEYGHLCEELEAVRFQEEEQVIRGATVVGMTTSGAARYHSVLQRVVPRIVVIEEAAEVMEAHIITSLSHNTKHTILIGDHKQLRPKPTVYELAQKYNLEVSLFERMVMNSMECKRLSIQHRMRPEIAALTKKIYDHEIFDHESVCQFEDIAGVCNNLFFIEHCQPESHVGGLQSYANHHEAEFVVALCNYLLLQGYMKCQITILTMYTGQLLHLQELMPKQKFDGVKVCAVDNFQGEENDIILLSLVRSNSEGRIGFLAESNRICVALSRARQGLYCIGNFSLLKSQSRLWKEICDDLQTKEAIGDTLQLVCKWHSNVTSVKKASQFNRLGGCNMPCEVRLDCGHACDKQCHASSHARGRCNKMCFNRCPNDHPCGERCHYPHNCPNCNQEMLKTVPQCGHEQTMPCSVDPARFSCRMECEKILPCQHSCRNECGQKCTTRCKYRCIKHLPCGHQKSVFCYEDPQTIFCYETCPRNLECGHKCPSVCGTPCQEVQCEELCQSTCKRGHSCQMHCHFGSSCKDCMVEVNMTIPECGHSIKMPCYVDPATLKCKQQCQRVRVCGHPCKETCSKNCEARPCKVFVARKLPCDHEVSLVCHRKPEKYICKNEVEVHLPCGHKATLECHVAKDGLENVLCKTQVEKELRCTHKITLPCFKKPDECVCRRKVDVQLTCGHIKSLQCSTATAGLTDFLCTIIVSRTLPCNHEASLPCYIKPEEHCCEEEVEIKLTCGHEKLTICSSTSDELQGEVCDTSVTRKLPCGHVKEMRCSDKPEEIYCDAPCERFLPCGHLCPNKCGDDCATFRCAVEVKKYLSCGNHKVNCLCSEDVSQLICSNQCRRKLTCGHQCPGKCFEDCCEQKCQTKVVRKLSCAGNHSLQMPCSGDPKSIACQKHCNRKLGCGHPCPGRCSQPCEKIKCRRRVEKIYPCGHKEQLSCFESKTAYCRLPCRRRKACNHMCKGVCGEPCSYSPCGVLMGKSLPCGHKVKMPCSYSVNDVQCPVPCRTELPCGHQCSGTCGECQPRGSHQMCQHPCSRLLICLHRCKATCCQPCPPCDKECGRRCPHAICSERCSLPCKPCKELCTWSCPHYQCNNLCGEECDRPRCDAPCPKKLACGHPCIGLCGENCPTLCSVCHNKRLFSILGEGRGKAMKNTRYLQLHDCGHILTVEQMDAWMMHQLGREAQLIRCPMCSKAITFSFRYGNLVKRTLIYYDNIRKEIADLANEAAKFSSRLMIHQSSYNVQKMKFPRDVLAKLQGFSRAAHSNILDRIHVRNVPFIYTIKNHLLILHQVHKALLNLQAVAEHQASSKDHPEIKQYSGTVKQGLENILEYLMKPQLDLRTLNQVYVNTRKLSLFALILEVQLEAIKRQMSLSSMGETRLKIAYDEFHLFLQGKNDALPVDPLEKIVASLRKEVGLAFLQPEEPKDFENFPGFSRGVWRLCEHRQVYYTRLIVRDGKEVTVVSTSCKQCVDKMESTCEI